MYVVTSARLVRGRRYEDVAAAAVEGGATAVQLRAPEIRAEALLPLATDLAALCRAEGVLFIVDDAVEVAVECGAPGVHLGQADNPATARARLRPGMVLGISVDTPEQARAADALGADYLGVTVWATSTKPEARPVGLEGLRQIVGVTPLPVVGIGGIDAASAGAVIRAGATGVAVVSAVGAARDPIAATRALVDAVDRARAAHEGMGPE